MLSVHSAPLTRPTRVLGYPVLSWRCLGRAYAILFERDAEYAQRWGVAIFEHGKASGVSYHEREQDARHDFVRR